ncbi:xanthine dehydrogenase family protein molybdopterin-binding subunit [Methylobacterium planeticum]|uniref:Xanthine dehydrogenase family protein molybdopterin-binding subunit n=1 Tax=Methylobacterium planeticum TaxID=2615211 RepID=A0A6N6MPY6_9HYPH|nr:molybdopterin cofactor-binding domain-containing protein [Methylobacterium planeticum]KAB1072061.1 xanthine dehydrogenase family protein molybdopterin-binding subunit [Methylobacterium planeticum]
MQTGVSRRALLRGSALVVGFTLAGLRPEAGIAGSSTAPTKSVAADDVDAYLALSRDGRATIYSGKVDLGTGLRTALTQIAAEELDLPLDHVTLVQGDTALTPDQGPTYGSLSIQNGGMQLRLAAATARRQILALAADRLGQKAESLVAEGGSVRPQAGGTPIPYADLLRDGRFALKLDKDVATKDPDRFALVGHAVQRLDIPDKVSGRFTYMQDFRLPGMLHGRVVRPAAIGAQLLGIDEASVRDVPGLIKVVREGNFLGVVARTEWGAIRAARQLAAQWSQPETLPEQARLWEHVRATRITKDDVTMNVGDAGAALASAARTLSATYDFAIHTHGSIGPSCAVAMLSEGRLSVWTASQMTHALRKQLAAMLGLPQDDVRCIYIEGSGCYGRNGHEDAAADAAMLARAVGHPVRVQWSRADEHGWDPKGPPTLIDLTGALDAEGNVAAWTSAFFIPEGAAGNVPLVAADLAGLPRETTYAPGNIIQNSGIPYAFPNVRTVCHRLAETPLRPSWIRTPGRLQNTFANEAFLDELAAAAGADPLAYRLRALGDARGIAVLTRAAELAGWEPRPSPRPQGGDVLRGRGLSYVKYELYRTYVAAVAEVEVERATGAIRVRRITVVQDCGQVINPDGVRNQIEGNMLQTVSRTLREEVTFDRARVTSLDWASYPILTFPEIPEVVIDLIDRPRDKPWGAGEPSAAIVPSVISNAVFDATGVRLRSVPFTPEKVKAGLQRT